MRILIPIGCRSDKGLSAPLIKLLEADKDVEVITKDLSESAGDFTMSLLEMEQYLWTFGLQCTVGDKKLSLGDDKLDLVVIFGDRIEMLAVAIAARQEGVKIAHVYAGCNGELNSEKATLDDVNRLCISALASMWFCESWLAARNIAKLLAVKGDHDAVRTGRFDANKIFIVGITHLDDVKVDESLVPHYLHHHPFNQPSYDLVLYNPIRDKELIIKEIKEIRLMVNLNHTIWINANPDSFDTKVEDVIGPFYHKIKDYHVDLERSKFLGLLKNCSRFITNSTTAIYEAPHFLKPEQIVMVGNRNKDRNRGPFKTGASKKILHVIKHGKLPEIEIKQRTSVVGFDVPYRQGRRFG